MASFFVYLLLSLAVTSLNELVAAVLKSRGKYLWEAIANLFEEDKDWSSNSARAVEIAAADALGRVRDAVAALQSSAADAQRAQDRKTAAQAHVDAAKAIYDAVVKALGAGGAATALLAEKAGAAAASKSAAERELADATSAASAVFAQHQALLSSQAADEGLRRAKLSVAAVQARSVADAARAISHANPADPIKLEAKNAAVAAATQAEAAAAVPSLAPQGNWSERLYDHSLIQALYQNTANGSKRPSYIPSQTFAVALMDLVLPSGTAARANTFAEIRSAIDKIPYNRSNRNIKEALLSLVREAENTTDATSSAIKKVQDQIEVWFNDTMDRVGGWYKRQTQYVVFVLALILVLVLNLDTIMIARALNRDSALRATVVGLAERATQPGPNQVTVSFPTDRSTAETNTTQPATQPSTANIQAANAEFQARLNDIEQLGIPIGWKFSSPSGSDGHPVPNDPRRLYLPWRSAPALATGNLLLKFLGLLLTTLAATLGAPFWFDVLNKIVTIRASGKAPEEQPKSPKEVPTPRQAAAGATPAPGGSLLT